MGRESGSSDPATSCDAHREHGPKKGCTLCHVLRLQAAARSNLPTLDPRWGVSLTAVPDSKQALALATWFSVRATPGSETVVGCAACAASGKAGRTGGRWAYTKFTAASTALRYSSLKKHHDSPTHKHNALKYLEVDVGPSCIVTHGAPTVSQFQEVWDHVRKGGSAEAGIAAVGGSNIRK